MLLRSWRISLAEEYFGADEALNALLAEAESFRENGLLYQSAKSFLKAAAHVLKSGPPCLSNACQALC